MSYLYDEKQGNEQEITYVLKMFQKELKYNYSKLQFIETLRIIHNQTSGIVDGKTRFILKALKLDKFIADYLHSPKPQHKLFALNAISDLKLDGHTSYITKLIKSSDVNMHSKALITKINLNPEETLEFLVKMRIRVSNWDVNEIISTVSNYKKINYKSLIFSTDTRISGLGIQLAETHGASELKTIIGNKITAQNQHIAEDAIIAYASFANTKSDFDFLMYKYELAPQKAQLAVIKTIALSSDKKIVLHFLEWLVEYKPLPNKLAALRIMLEIDHDFLLKYRNSSDTIIKQAYLQILDLNT